MGVVNTKMEPFEWLLLLILSVLWGGSFFLRVPRRCRQGLAAVDHCRSAGGAGRRSLSI